MFTQESKTKQSILLGASKLFIRFRLGIYEACATWCENKVLFEWTQLSCDCWKTAQQEALRLFDTQIKAYLLEIETEMENM